MVKIGFDKTDPIGRKFYFDDSAVLLSNPPKYKVNYVDDENDIDYVLCKDVFTLKPAPADKQKQEKTIDTTSISVKDNISNVKVIDKNTLPKSTISVAKDTTITENKDNIEVEKQKKKPGRKKKEQTVIENKDIITNNTTNEIRKFEYIVIDEYLDNIEKFQDMLNKYGQDGWELCGFEVYKDGIMKPNSVLCVLKKLKK